MRRLLSLSHAHVRCLPRPLRVATQAKERERALRDRSEVLGCCTGRSQGVAHEVSHIQRLLNPFPSSAVLWCGVTVVTLGMSGCLNVNEVLRVYPRWPPVFQGEIR